MKAPRGTDLFRNSIATPSLVASIINGKYNNSLPLERQVRAYRDNGINLATNTMANWVIKSADNYLPLFYDRLHELIYDNHIIHADETPVKVMCIDNNKIRNGKKTHMRVYRNRPTENARPIVLFERQPSRKADHPRDFLKNFSGTVITDGYQVYHKLSRERDDLTIGGCRIHARRPFTIGRKNFVLIETSNGARSSAMIYNIVKTSKANYLNVYQYFELLLTEIPKHMNDTDLSPQE